MTATPAPANQLNQSKQLNPAVQITCVVLGLIEFVFRFLIAFVLCLTIMGLIIYIDLTGHNALQKLLTPYLWELVG